ncbi:hypothetical protein SEMRO_1299_G260690.1 [Seminavis robusta]|uniref:Uncharacterized protein n=1 Tax=Seminavis robusta TaxID=568900 RepID=A0A9N8EJD9_9STRA|nr:hypothetical protein SEMRO_1299_G260690.1 [Seminavis robusta]|eukprot:Sro1299_g260690.1 n/a (207) ;mRNA; f:28098-28718
MVKTRSSKSEYSGTPEARRGRGKSTGGSSRKPSPAVVSVTGSSRKVKNKVGSPAPRKKSLFSDDEDDYDNKGYSSDEFNFGEEEDELGEQSDSNHSVSTTGSGARKRLPKNVLKAVLTDIQHEEGIDVFHLASPQALRNILDKRPELYGNRRDITRVAIGKKVIKWRKKFHESKESWNQQLRDLGITEKVKPVAARGAADKPAAAK